MSTTPFEKESDFYQCQRQDVTRSRRMLVASMVSTRLRFLPQRGGTHCTCIILLRFLWALQVQPAASSLELLPATAPGRVLEFDSVLDFDSHLVQDNVNIVGSYSPSQSSGDISIHQTFSGNCYHIQHIRPFPSPPYSYLEGNPSAVASSSTTYPPPPVVGNNIPISTYTVLESSSVKAYQPEQEQEQQSQPVGHPLYAASSYRTSHQ